MYDRTSLPCGTRRVSVCAEMRTQSHLASSLGAPLVSCSSASPGTRYAGRSEASAFFCLKRSGSVVARLLLPPPLVLAVKTFVGLMSRKSREAASLLVTEERIRDGETRLPSPMVSSSSSAISALFASKGT